MVTYRVTARSSGVLIMSLSAHLDFQREGQPRLQSALSRDSNVSLYTQKSARSGNGPRHSRWSCDVFRCPCPSRSWMTRDSEKALSRTPRAKPLYGSRRYATTPGAHTATSASFITALAAAAGQTSAVLIKDRPQIHFQRRVSDPEDIALELAEAFAFGDGVGALEIGFQKPDFGNAFGNVIVAASLHLGETVVTNDLDAQERDSRGRLFQVELLAQQPQILALFAFFVRVEARFLEFKIGDGVLHSLADKIDPLLNLR